MSHPWSPAADQAEYDVRLEYGLQGLRALCADPLPTIVIVDVLSFSTSVSVAVERGALLLRSRRCVATCLEP